MEYLTMVEKGKITPQQEIELLKARNAWLMTVNTKVENKNKTLSDDNDKLRKLLETYKRNQSLTERWARGVEN